ncbi:TPA: hypothetical protein DCZ39_06975 [Patescibacteria group bacterium]|nr:hypothetical protein [Candidatus Gracilibacteria bacterium]
MTGKTFTLVSGFYIGINDISFADPLATNEILAPIIMQNNTIIPSDVIEVQFDAGTLITYSGNQFTGTLSAPTLSAGLNLP